MPDLSLAIVLLVIAALGALPGYVYLISKFAQAGRHAGTKAFIDHNSKGDDGGPNPKTR